MSLDDGVNSYFTATTLSGNFGPNDVLHHSGLSSTLPLSSAVRDRYVSSSRAIDQSEPGLITC